MTINYLAGSRIQGLSSDTKPTNVQDFSTWEEVDTEKIYTYYKDTPAWKKLGSPSVGGWKELGRTTLGGAGDTIDVTSLANKRYYMVLSSGKSTGVLTDKFLLGNSTIDTGSNYSYRTSVDGAGDTTGTSTAFMYDALGGLTGVNKFNVGYLANLSANEKLLSGHGVITDTTGAGTAPQRSEYVGKWANTSNVLDRWQNLNTGAGDYNTGYETVILGWDPVDTHTTNFWQELDDSSWSSGTNWSSNTFSAKKYLWIQAWIKGTSANLNGRFTFNGDTGTNYARRVSINGGSDITGTSQNFIDTGFSATSGFDFINMFIINNSANEKLIISHTVGRNSTGGGTAPSRKELVGKWVNTSNQITSINLDGNSTLTGGQLKVWGSD